MDVMLFVFMIPPSDRIQKKKAARGVTTTYSKALDPERWDEDLHVYIVITPLCQRADFM